MKCRVCGSALPEGAMFCGECGSSVTAQPLSRRAARPHRSDTSVIDPLPGPAVAGPAVVDAGIGEAVDDTTGDDAAGPRHPVILSISTGERATVSAGGLLGRRPVAQPGEHVEQVVQVTDSSRTVSKTHLEFGFDEGWFWICDRYSGNGTVVHPPSGHGQARLCEPGRRYRVLRGSRIEIGDQYIDVA